MAYKKARASTTATEALKILWEEGFFHSWKKMASIEENLGKRGNHFSNSELGMALNRATHLTRRGKRRNYEYIQKFPFEIHTPKPGTEKKK